MEIEKHDMLISRCTSFLNFLPNTKIVKVKSHPLIQVEYLMGVAEGFSTCGRAKACVKGLITTLKRKYHNRKYSLYEGIKPIND